MRLRTSALDTKKYKSRFSLVQGRHLTQDEIMYIATGLMLFFSVLLFAGWEAFAVFMQYIAYAAIVLVFVFGFMRLDTEEEQMKKFARANNFEFKPYPGREFIPKRLKDGDRKHAEYGFMGTLTDGSVFRLMLLNDTRHDEKIHDYWAIHIELQGELPEFILDSWYNSIMIERKSSDYHQVTLEGDFSDYFGLYLPKGSHINVLSVMSPDVMEAMIEFWQDTDIIIEGANVWFVTYRTNDKKDVQALFDAAEAIVPELNHRASTYRA